MSDMKLKIDQKKLSKSLQSLLSEVTHWDSEIAMALGVITLRGRKFEIQLKLTNERDDFIDDVRYHCMGPGDNND